MGKGRVEVEREIPQGTVNYNTFRREAIKLHKKCKCGSPSNLLVEEIERKDAFYVDNAKVICKECKINGLKENHTKPSLTTKRDYILDL